MTSGSILDYEPVYPKFHLPASARLAWQTTGKNPAAQMAEIWKLRRSFGRLTPREYYFFGLYDDSKFTSGEKERFVGAETTSWIRYLSNDQKWWAVKRDKVVFYGLMQGYGLPVPRVKAMYHAFRHYPDATMLRTTDELRRFLRVPDSHPFFGKPVVGGRGLGLAQVTGYDPATDELIFPQERRVSVQDFIESIDRYANVGYLFQEVKHPHEDIRAICGDRLATVRVLVLLGRSGPELFRAFWKLPVAPHVDDTFWRPGNMAAALDLATGQVTRVVTGVGHELALVSRHPDSGALLPGARVPHWAEMKEFCLTAARTMPGIKLQGWDLASCVDGPIIIEGDAGGSFAVPQLASGTGLLNDQFFGFVAENGFRPKRATDRLIRGLRRLRRAF